MDVYNVTQKKTIKYKVVSSTTYSYVSFTANAGDVIRVMNYCNYSTSSTFYMYVTGVNIPTAGGLGTSTGAQSILNATATDSFGNPLTVTATVKLGSLTPGTNIVYTLTATDHLGNTHSIDTAPIGVYDVSDIDLSYVVGMSDVIKLTSNGKEFDAKATDSFGNACDITIEAAEGYVFSGGQKIVLYIVATDKAGNRVVSEAIGTTDN